MSGSMKNKPGCRVRPCCSPFSLFVTLGACGPAAGTRITLKLPDGTTFDDYTTTYPSDPRIYPDFPRGVALTYTATPTVEGYNSASGTIGPFNPSPGVTQVFSGFSLTLQEGYACCPIASGHPISNPPAPCDPFPISRLQLTDANGTWDLIPRVVSGAFQGTWGICYAFTRDGYVYRADDAGGKHCDTTPSVAGAVQYILYCPSQASDSNTPPLTGSHDTWRLVQVWPGCSTYVSTGFGGGTGAPLGWGPAAVNADGVSFSQAGGYYLSSVTGSIQNSPGCTPVALSFALSGSPAVPANGPPGGTSVTVMEAP